MRHIRLKPMVLCSSRYLIKVLMASGLTLTAYGQATESQPKERELQVPPITLSIEDVAEVNVRPGLPPASKLIAPQRAVPLPVAGELKVVAPDLPEVLNSNPGNRSGLFGPDLALQAAIEAGNNGLLKSSIALQRAGIGPSFQLQVEHQLLDGFGAKETPEQGYHRTDDLQGVYRSGIGSADIDVSGRYRRIEDGLQGRGGDHHSFSDQLVAGDLQIEIDPTDVLTVKGEIGGSSSSRAFRGSESAIMTELEGWAAAVATAQIRELDIGVTTSYSFRHMGGGIDPAHRLLGQLELGYDLAIPIRVAARGGLQYASEDENSNVRFPFQLSLIGTPHELVTLRVSAGHEVVDRSLSGLYERLGFLEEPTAVLDTRQWFGDAFIRAAVLDDLQVVASLRGETGVQRVDIEGEVGKSGLHSLVQEDSGTLQTGIGLRWDINRTAALSLDWSGAFFDVPLYQAPHIVSVGMQATWDRGRYGFDNYIDWVFPSELESSRHAASNIALPVISASGFYHISDTIAVIANVADLLQPLSDRPRYELAPYADPGFQASVGVEVNL